MPKLEELIKNDKITQRLLDYLLKTLNFSIEEELESQTILTYPKLEQALGLRHEILEAQIHSLLELGILQKKEAKKVQCCPKCQSISMHPSMICPSCNSSQMVRVELIEHLKCGYVGPEHEFNVKESFQCPKCGRTLTQIGVDYRRTGPMYVCSCGQKFSAPKELWVCNECDNMFSPENIGTRLLNEYYLPEENKTTIIGLFFDLKPIINYFFEMGFQVVSPALVVGFSGAEHSYDILGINNSNKKSIILRLYFDEKGMGVRQIAGLYAEAMDSVVIRKGLKRPEHIIALCVPKAEQNARRQAEVYGIICVEAYDSVDALDKLKKSNWHGTIVKYQSLLP